MYPPQLVFITITSITLMLDAPYMHVNHIFKKKSNLPKRLQLGPYMHVNHIFKKNQTFQRDYNWLPDFTDSIFYNHQNDSQLQPFRNTVHEDRRNTMNY